MPLAAVVAPRGHRPVDLVLEEIAETLGSGESAKLRGFAALSESGRSCILASSRRNSSEQ
ncbi:MAG: hypothetical protein FJX06_04550 [Alphaproteobacteria bacterium]|nr:hypothetical protein [Alphaproteobacteria bacterium]